MSRPIATWLIAFALIVGAATLLLLYDTDRPSSWDSSGSQRTQTTHDDLPLREGMDTTPALSAPTREDLTQGGVAAVTGVIINNSGRPVSQARIRASQAGVHAQVVRSDTNGSFTIPAQVSKSITLAVEAVGYEPLTREYTTGSGPLNIVLLPIGEKKLLHGYVTDESGLPVTDFSVTAYGDSGRTSRQFDNCLGGRFEIELLSAPDYREILEVRARGFMAQSANITSASFDSPLHIQLEKAVMIDGIIVDSNGDPVQGARVVGFYSDSPPRRCDCVSDAKGIFGLATGLDLLPDMILVTHHRYAPHVVTRVGQHWDQLRIVLTEGATLVGRVYRPGGGPARGANVIVELAKPSMMLSWFGQDVSDEQGQYVIRRVPLTAVVLSATHNEGDRIFASLKQTISVAASQDYAVDIGLNVCPQISGTIVLVEDQEPIVLTADLLREPGSSVVATWQGNSGSTFALAVPCDAEFGNYVIRVSADPDTWLDTEVDYMGSNIDNLQVRFSIGEAVIASQKR